jgi:hypothetical protein
MLALSAHSIRSQPPLLPEVQGVAWPPAFTALIEKNEDQILERLDKIKRKL